MRPLVVVNETTTWLRELRGAEVVLAKDYLTQAEIHGRSSYKVFNLCSSYRYQSSGYYVSLLAAARGQRPSPSVAIIQDLKATEIVRIRSEGLEALIDRSLRSLKGDRFILSIYFGRNVSKRYDQLASQLFQLFDCPFLRATFQRAAASAGKRDQEEDGRPWQLVSIVPIAARDVPEHHRELVLEAAERYFGRQRWRTARPSKATYDLAILFDPEEPEPPSDPRTIKRFERAAKKVGMTPWVIDKEEYGRLGEYDALFIRETTNVHHHTYRFARRAAAEGMVVIDDPDSILLCTNKVYLAELLERHGVPAPKTMVVHRGNLAEVGPTLGFPAVLKEPDSSFSRGVKKVSNELELLQEGVRMLQSSELIVAQAFVPTDYDWRIGVLDGQALWACRYHMARGHWQIAKDAGNGERSYGRVEAVPLGQVPRQVVSTALRAAGYIGRGLYGVDVKAFGRKAIVIEVNDNPTIQVGYEDVILGDFLYERIMETFVERLEARYRSSAASR
jgi:glutathione synthase/RimK-type ligase-like ATP-grasp enzyme